MRICWDNLKELRYSKRTGKWFIKTKAGNYHYYRYEDECKFCKEPFLININKIGNFCSNNCFHKNGRSKEHRKNISKVKKEAYVGKNNPNYGNKWSEEQKKKMSFKKKGQRKGIKRPRHSLRMLGQGNPNWQGGITLEEYCEVWKDKEYKKSIIERDGKECLNPLCYKNSHKLCAHHIDYDKKNCSPSNLITTCFSCNARANFNREFWQKHYEEIMIQRRI